MSNYAGILAQMRIEHAEIDAEMARLHERRQALMAAINGLAALSGEAPLAPVVRPVARRSGTVVDAVRRVVASEPSGIHLSSIAQRVDRDVTQIGTVLRRLMQSGDVVRLGHGVYAPVCDGAEEVA